MPTLTGGAIAAITFDQRRQGAVAVTAPVHSVGDGTLATGTEFCLLGPLVVRSGGAVIPVQAGRQRTVLAALLLDAGRAVTVDELAEALWGDDPPPSARVAVQNYVMRLRHVLGEAEGSRISTHPPGYQIRVEPGELDVTRFEELVGSARAAARTRSWDAVAGQTREALALWRGQPLADVNSELLAARELPYLAELRLQALEVRLDADLHLGRHAEVIIELRQLASANPLRERLHGMLMLALYRDGRQAEALTAYQDARAVLVEELGAEPGTGLRHLHHQILTADPDLDFPATKPTVATVRPPVSGAGVLAPPSRLWQPRLPRLPPLAPAGWAVVGAVLVADAVVLGVSLANSGSSPATRPAAVADSAVPPPAPPPAIGPICGASASAGGRPALCVSTPQGDPGVVFTVHDSGFTPGTHIVIVVIFYPPPLPGQKGYSAVLRTFTVATDGSFRLGPFQPGLYKVTGTGIGAARPTVFFRVVPPPY